ncbi:hypothetical protein [Mesorhizobium japonicum]|uniref:hypothetical protein n=1 Tax=Mesorhizobium japonicum TaxID=2066070 RepID=UPI003B59C4C5
MTTHIDDNLDLDGDSVVCRHCGTEIGTAEAPLSKALVRESDSAADNPGVRADPTTFASRRVVSRRAICPGCLTQLRFEIVPADEAELRHSSLAVSR